jgi:hypothetical protein
VVVEGQARRGRLAGTGGRARQPHQHDRFRNPETRPAKVASVSAGHDSIPPDVMSRKGENRHAAVRNFDDSGGVREIFSPAGRATGKTGAALKVARTAVR